MRDPISGINSEDGESWLRWFWADIWKTADTVAVDIRHQPINPISSRQSGVYSWLQYTEDSAQRIPSHPALVFTLELHQLYVTVFF